MASTKQTMELLAIYTLKPLSIAAIEKTLGITFKKAIEATHYAQIGEAMIAYTNFNVLTLINWTKESAQETLSSIGVINDASTINQDYPILVDSSIEKAFTIDNEKITLKELNILNLIIISHVISQSVALEVYEKKLSEYYEKSRKLIIDVSTFSIYKRNLLAKFSKQLVLIRHDMLIDLFLLDKPNILWDNENAELLYNKLASSLELKDRFDVIEYKLDSIKDDIAMIMDLTNHNHSSFLEWIIIILIMIEIVMSLMEWFGLK
ncbi:MAG: RMD1 family protein [Sulfurimonas sp.]|nr:RMD1 family protein [Sulfurimonas sp.]MDD3060901.1 RMD1 family protein [Sulfurimonas sp.]MDD5201848.1 RMD1 family protein [Sulfurimonas sp.]